MDYLFWNRDAFMVILRASDLLFEMRKLVAWHVIRNSFRFAVDFRLELPTSRSKRQIS